MKNSFFKISIFVVFISFLSCSSDDNTSTPTLDGDIKATWKLNKEWFNDTQITLNQCKLNERFTFNNTTFQAIYDDDNNSGNPSNCDMNTTNGTYLVSTNNSGKSITFTFQDGGAVVFTSQILELSSTKLVLLDSDSEGSLKQEWLKIE